MYDITNHPSSITFKGMSIEFQATQTNVEVFCLIKIFIDNSVVDICSQTATILLEDTADNNSRSAHGNLLSRRSANSFSVCTKENVTFSNDMEVSNVHIAIEHGGNCEVILNFSKCAEPDNVIEAHAISLGDTNVMAGVDSIEMFYGHNVTVTMNDICDECRERFYIPNMRPTGQFPYFLNSCDYHKHSCRLYVY